MDINTEYLFKMAERDLLKCLSGLEDNELPKSNNLHQDIQIKRKSITYFLHSTNYSVPGFDILLEFFIDENDSFRGEYRLMLTENMEFIDEFLVSK